MGGVDQFLWSKSSRQQPPAATCHNSFAVLSSLVESSSDRDRHNDRVGRRNKGHNKASVDRNQYSDRGKLTSKIYYDICLALITFINQLAQKCGPLYKRHFIEICENVFMSGDINFRREKMRSAFHKTLFFYYHWNYFTFL